MSDFLLNYGSRKIGHDGVVWSYTISMGFPRVDEVSTGASGFGVSRLGIRA